MHDGFSGGAFVDTAGGLLGRHDRGVHPRAGGRHPDGDRLEDCGERARARPAEARLPRDRRPAGRRARTSARRCGGDKALLVVGVTAGSPAAAAGLLVGDVLLALDGQPISSPEDLLDLLVGDRVGRTVTLRVLRGRSVTEVPVTIGERPVQ